MFFEKGLPSNIEAERSILGAIILDNAVCNQAIELLRREDFFLDSHRRIYEKMVALSERGSIIDLVTLSEELRKAARGDKDAAARIARAYFRGATDAEADPNRYEGWLQYAAALGNGIACYELALYYRRQGQPVPAAQYESRARDLGYTPPRTLDNVRK